MTNKEKIDKLSKQDYVLRGYSEWYLELYQNAGGNWKDYNSDIAAGARRRYQSYKEIGNGLVYARQRLSKYMKSIVSVHKSPLKGIYESK